jgi:hypothetical protein
MLDALEHVRQAFELIGIDANLFSWGHLAEVSQRGTRTASSDEPRS